jgi:hypothetical protein
MGLPKTIERSRVRVAVIGAPRSSIRCGTREPRDGDCAFWCAPLNFSRSKSLDSSRVQLPVGQSPLPVCYLIRAGGENEGDIARFGVVQ